MHTHGSMGIHTHPLHKLLRVSIYRLHHKCSRMYHLDTTGRLFQCHLQTIPANHHHTPIQCLLPLKTWIPHFTILPHIILKSMYMVPRLKRPRRRYITIAQFLLRFRMLPASFPPRPSHNPLQKATPPHPVLSLSGHPSSHRNLSLDSSPPMSNRNSSTSLSRVFQSTTAHWTWASPPFPSSSGSIHIDGTPWTINSWRASARGLSRKNPRFVRLTPSFS
jgi:hypothetical protein